MLSSQRCLCFQELFDEYSRALAGIDAKHFRLRAFLFRASEFPLTPEELEDAEQFFRKSSRSSR